MDFPGSNWLSPVPINLAYQPYPSNVDTLSTTCSVSYYSIWGVPPYHPSNHTASVSFYSAQSSATGNPTYSSAQWSPLSPSSGALPHSFQACTSQLAAKQLDCQSEVSNFKYKGMRLLDLPADDFFMGLRHPRFVRLVRKHLRNATDYRGQLIERILAEGLLKPLAMDEQGNFVAQTVVLHAGAYQEQVANAILPHVALLIRDKYGNRILQAALSVFSMENVRVMIDQLSGAEVMAMTDRYGRYVAYEILENFDVSIFAPLVSVLANPDKLQVVAESSIGYNVVLKLLRRLAPVSVDVADTGSVAAHLLDGVAAAIVAKAAFLIPSKFGNFVVTELLGMPTLARHRDEIINNYICKNIMSLSRSRFPSHVVEQALRNSTSDALNGLFDAVLHEKDRFGRCVFEVLVNDILGNYVVQTMIRIAIELLNGKRQGSAHWFFELRKKVDAMAPQLEKRASGNKILALFKPYTLITMPS